jgi:hypothetical protein
MNEAMLLQQLRYRLPLRDWSVKSGELVLHDANLIMPTVADQTSWYESQVFTYGKWRPFQLAFILANLESIVVKESPERKIVDLIWFPTGGGKTEAYLGLSAFTIFYERIINSENLGSTVLMRYTLRLLTTQQYERAASLICACEFLRKKQPALLGEKVIRVGLWVGTNTTPNEMSDAVSKFQALYNKKGDNPFVVLKCPWCGARMGVVDSGKKDRKIVGYTVRLDGRKQRLSFSCSNQICDFSGDNDLPLTVIDEDIYNNPPELLIGTVDKFATLPIRPEATRLFGLNNGLREGAPSLIIQDELHLISGPLGSMVGHYETMIAELSKHTKESIYSPKIIASTATISRAKEQCHALFACGKENVVQFPPSGIDYSDSFFAVEDSSQRGRLYIGVCAPVTSFSTASIRMYASILHAVPDMEVEQTSDLDPYWTNIGYYNSIRELGQAATWMSSDIREYLDKIYLRTRDYPEENRPQRRYLRNVQELTSRIKGEEISTSLQKLGTQYHGSDNQAVDICLASNMISVGLDIPRLGLMTVFGQPKTTSEYIQATSRVGRDSRNAPGVVIAMYNPSRPRDRSHYEHFQAYHSRIYTNVEPTSVTPFSAPLRQRALHAIIIGYLRLTADEEYNKGRPVLPSKDKVAELRDIIARRVRCVDPDEEINTLSHFDDIIRQWENDEPAVFFGSNFSDAIPLMYPSGSLPNEKWKGRGFKIPLSMRNVDPDSKVSILREYRLRGE